MSLTTAITSSRSGSTPVSLTPPVPIDTHRGIGEIILSFFREKAKDIAKSFGYTCGWLVESLPSTPPEVKTFGGLMGDIKNFISATEVPEKTKKVHDAVVKFFSEPGIDTARGILKESTSWINSTCDGIDLSSKFLPITSEVMRWIKGVNFSATILGSGNGAIENIQTINNLTEYNLPKVGQHLIKLAADVSYLTLGGVGLFFIVSGAPFIPWVMLACATSGLAFSVGGFFYERIVDPDKNFQDPKNVIHNLQKEKNHLQDRLTAASA